MNQRKVIFFYLSAAVIFLFSFTACEEEEINNDPDQEVINTEMETSEFVETLMNELYLWYNEVPEIDITQYKNASEVFYELLYDDIDKWSFITTVQQYEQITKGESKSYGVYFKYDENDDVRVAFTYENSPMGKAGVERSFILEKINGQDIDNLINDESFEKEITQETNTFIFRNNQDKLDTLTLTQSTFQSDAILYSDTFNLDNKITGYCVLNTFMEYSDSEIDSVFSRFHSAGIDELILDLRYNGGGAVSIAQDLAGVMCPNASLGNTFIHFANNPKYTLYDTIYHLKAPGYNLDLDRLFVITSSQTASASEAIINGLQPYMDVVQIGHVTHGKPVGMNGFEKNGYMMLPVTFSLSNSEGKAGYYDGLQPDYIMADDLSKQFGNPEEASLQAAMKLIKGESVPQQKKSRALPRQAFELTGMRHWIGHY